MRSYSASELNVIRARPQGAKWYLAVHRPLPVAYFQLTSNVSYPASKLDVTYISGASQAIRENQTVWVGTASGLYDLGMARIKHIPTSNSILWVAESGSGLINWNQSASTYLTVMNEMRPWSRHPRYDTAVNQWRMDGDIAFSAEKQFAPYPNIDMTTIGVLNGASSFSASYIGSSSLFLDNSYLLNSWYFPDGTTSTGSLGTEANPITKTYTSPCPGGSYVRLQLVDSAGGSSWGHRLTFLYNDYSQIPKVTLAEISGGIEQGGYTTQLTVYNLDDTDIPPGTEIFIFEEPNYAGSRVPLGTNKTLSKNIIFRGWTTREVNTINPLISSATIEATTIDGIMQQMSSYDIFMAKVDSLTGASNWIETENLSLDRVAHQGLRWRSNVFEICNFTPASGLAIQNNIQFQSLGKADLFTQLRSNYHDRGYLGFFGSDQQSNLYGFADAQITGGSDSVPVIMHIGKPDRMNAVQVDRDYRDLNSQVQLYAVASVTPFGAESPGGVMGYFGTTQEISQGLLVDGQDTLTTWSGNLRAKQNAEFKRVTIPLAGNYKLDAIPQSRITTSLSAQDNARGLVWDNKQFWLNNVRSIYDSAAGYAHQEIELSEIVDGIGGSAITFPTVDDIVSIPIPLPTSQPSVPSTTTPAFGTGMKTVYVMTRFTLGRTRDFSASSPEWHDITPSSAGVFGDFILDPWNPAQRGFLATSTGVWRSTDLHLSSPTWELVLDEADVLTNLGATATDRWYKIVASINFQDFVAVAFQATVGGFTRVCCAKSTDGGDTWSIADVISVAANQLFWGAFDYVPHAISGDVRLYCAFEGVLTGRSLGSLAISNDGGDTWAVTDTFTGNQGGSFSTPVAVHCPYNGNTSGNLVYVSDRGSGWSGLYYSSDSGASHQRIQVTAHIGGRRNFETYTQDNQLGYRWISGDILTVTNNGFTSVSNATLSGFSGNIRGGGGFPTNDEQFYAISTAGIFVSTDRGESWIDKTGDWAWGFADWEDSGGVIVPLWTE